LAVGYETVKSMQGCPRNQQTERGVLALDPQIMLIAVTRARLSPCVIDHLRLRRASPEQAETSTIRNN